MAIGDKMPQGMAFLRTPLVWVLLSLFLGVGLRSYHYSRDPAVWHDEAALILNVVNKRPMELFGPLSQPSALRW